MKRSLVAPNIEALLAYEPGKPIEELARELGTAWPKEGAIKLASNENPLGPSPRGILAAKEALESAQLYPEGSSFYLRERLAVHLKVRSDEIVIGAGSNELLDVLVHAFCAHDEEVLTPQYSFIVYKLAAQSHGVAFREVSQSNGFAYDVERILQAVSPRTKILFLANPNNPTGSTLARADFESLVDRLPPEILLVVDEAYFEYATRADYPDALAYRQRRERLIVVRTFSKIYGLAGLRVGYAIAPAEIAGYLHRVRMPFNANIAGQAAARAALDDQAHVEQSRTLNAAQLPRITVALGGLGFDVAPSQGNFVLTHVGKGRDSKRIYQQLLERGVVVRPLGIYGLSDHLRITVGTEAQNTRLLQTMESVLS